jgi:hypothetical protein
MILIEFALVSMMVILPILNLIKCYNNYLKIIKIILNTLKISSKIFKQISKQNTKDLNMFEISLNIIAVLKMI